MTENNHRSNFSTDGGQSTIDQARIPYISDDTRVSRAELMGTVSQEAFIEAVVTELADREAAFAQQDKTALKRFQQEFFSTPGIGQLIKLRYEDENQDESTMLGMLVSSFIALYDMPAELIFLVMDQLPGKLKRYLQENSQIFTLDIAQKLGKELHEAGNFLPALSRIQKRLVRLCDAKLISPANWEIESLFYSLERGILREVKVIIVDMIATFSADFSIFKSLPMMLEAYGVRPDQAREMSQEPVQELLNRQVNDEIFYNLVEKLLRSIDYHAIAQMIEKIDKLYGLDQDAKSKLLADQRDAVSVKAVEGFDLKQRISSSFSQLFAEKMFDVPKEMLGEATFKMVDEGYQVVNQLRSDGSMTLFELGIVEGKMRAILLSLLKQHGPTINDMVGLAMVRSRRVDTAQTVEELSMISKDYPLQVDGKTDVDNGITKILIANRVKMIKENNQSGPDILDSLDL